MTEQKKRHYPGRLDAPFIFGSREWYDVLDRDLPDVEFNEQARELAIRHGVRGDVRLSLGMFKTKAEFEAYRDRVLAMPLP